MLSRVLLVSRLHPSPCEGPSAMDRSPARRSGPGARRRALGDPAPAAGRIGDRRDRLDRGGRAIDDIALTTSTGRPSDPARDIVAVRRAPAAAGGSDPLRTSPADLEQIALPGLAGALRAPRRVDAAGGRRLHRPGQLLPRRRRPRDAVRRGRGADPRIRRRARHPGVGPGRDRVGGGAGSARSRLATDLCPDRGAGGPARRLPGPDLPDPEVRSASSWTRPGSGRTTRAGRTRPTRSCSG